MGAAGDQLWLGLITSYPEVVVNVGKIIFGETQRDTKKTGMKFREQNKKENSKQSNKYFEEEVSAFKKELEEKLGHQRTILTQAACALLNSGGGVIRAEIENEGYSYMRHGIGQDIENSFRDCVQSDHLSQYFDTVQEGSCLQIWVKTWSSESSLQPTKARLCCMETGLRQRSGTSVVKMKPLDVLKLLKRKETSAKKVPPSVAEPLWKRARIWDNNKHSRVAGVQEEEDILKAAAQFLERECLEYGELLDFAESTKVELKSFPTAEVSKKITTAEDLLKFVREKLREYISGFANAGGGYLIFGVGDDGKVIGYEENLQPDQLEMEVQEIIEDLPYFHFCTCVEKVTTECKIMPVYANRKRHGCVFAVRVEPFCCVVFAAPPDSWIVEDCAVKKLQVDKWIELMTAEDPDLSHFVDGFQIELSNACKPPLTKSVYSPKGITCVKGLQSSLWSANSNGITHKPEELCAELFSEYPGLETIMRWKMKELSISEGVLIFSRSWAVDVGLWKHPCVACDILLVATNIVPRLYTVTVDSSYSIFSANPVLEYSTNVARILKQKLVNEGGYTGKVCVVPHIIEFGVNGEVKTDQSLLVFYPSTYMVSREAIEELMQALTIVLLRFRSFLSDQLGCEFFNLLTIQQYEVLTKNLYKSKRLFVYGIPGTGKTLVALLVMEKIKNVFHCRSDEILYICENKPLCETVRMKNVCQAVTRFSFLKEKYTQPVKHIVIDEAQNFQLEDGDWYQKAVQITQGASPKPGVLWIFLDYLQKTHPHQCGLPPADAQQPLEYLTIGVRNGTKIFDGVKKCMFGMVCSLTKQDIPSEQLKSLVEATQCGHSLGGTLVEPEVNEDINGIVTYIVDKCLYYLQEGYPAGNIAVLCDTRKERDFYKPLLEEQMSREMRKLRWSVAFTTLDEARGKSIVIDSVRRFSGLERYIVFGILPHSVQRKNGDNLSLCMMSRANLHYHPLREK